MRVGDYVFATKYDDGDPLDQWCVGFYEGKTDRNPPRYVVMDEDGNSFRDNGFRRCELITSGEGDYILTRPDCRNLWDELYNFRLSGSGETKK